MRAILILGSFYLLTACGGSSDGTTAAKARGMSMPAAISAVPSK